MYCQERGIKTIDLFVKREIGGFRSLTPILKKSSERGVLYSSYPKVGVDYYTLPNILYFFGEMGKRIFLARKIRNLRSLHYIWSPLT